MKIVVFILVSAALAWLTRSSLRDVRSHGLYRLLAWASILGLILLNLEGWFDDPFSLHQIISWLLLAACLLLAVYSISLLYHMGKPSRERNDPSLIGIEKTTHLVTTGIYHYIRHPQYCSLLLLTWGVFFRNPFPVSGGLAAAATCLLAITAKVEEAENISYFGAAYEEYMRRTRMFVPHLF